MVNKLLLLKTSGTRVLGDVKIKKEIILLIFFLYLKCHFFEVTHPFRCNI